MSRVESSGGFIISFIISTLSVVYYSYLLNRGRELILSTAFTMFIFQFMFSLAFFFPEHTGFIIVIGAIISLFVLMKMTTKVDWKGKF